MLIFDVPDGLVASGLIVLWAVLSFEISSCRLG